MPVVRNTLDRSGFNTGAFLPYELRLQDFEIAMQDVYDFFFDINTNLIGRGLQRLDDMLRPSMMSGLLSDMLTASMAKHSRSLTTNNFHNGHPDLIVKGAYPNDRVAAGTEGVEIKSTRRSGGSVDTHGARHQWLCVFAYIVDDVTQPARDRLPMTFTEVYLNELSLEDFRRNARGELGTRTASPNREGLRKLRANWIFRASLP
jgi:hypothetical protein